MPYSGPPPVIGNFYIQNDNQDFWLYELRADGTPGWVRKGNIRDEGTGGLVNVPPVVAHGFDQEVTRLDLWRYLPDEATPTNSDLGFITDIAALDRIRYLGGVPIDIGFMVPVPVVQRIRFLTQSHALGFTTTLQLTRSIQLAAAMSLGFTMAAGADASTIHYLTSNQSSGFTIGALSLQRSRELTAAFALGYSQVQGFQKFLVASPSLGFNMSAPTLLKIKQLVAAMALGYDQTNTVQGFFGTKYIPTNTLFAGAVIPTAVNTTFTFASSGAAQGHLYDGDITTPAADPDGVRDATRSGTGSGLTGATRAAYDLGSAVAVTGVTIYTAPTFGFTSAVVFKIEWSDTSLTAGWTDAGATITVPAGTSQIASAAVPASAGAHRYWRIIYQSGSTSTNNAWIGELEFGDRYAPWSEGFSMASPVQRVKVLPSVALDEGFTMVATVAKLKAISAAMAEGFSMTTILSRSRYLTLAFTEGFNMALTLTHNPAPGTVYSPTAVLTTFTYTGASPPASEAALYDGSDTTDAADARGLQTDTSAAYDLGSAKTVGSVRVVNSPRFVSSGTITYKIQYSDTGLTGTWTDAGATVTMTTATGNVQVATIGAVGAHRYWRIVYQSGNIASNAWLGALQFRA